MNKDIRLSVGFFDHPKIIKLERKLGLEGVAALLRLWIWAAQNRPSGILSGMDNDDIEIVARWNGVANEFNAVTRELKLLDCVNEEQNLYAIHDWQEHNAWQSDAENRSNASRLARMAKTHPEIYAELEKAGIKGLSRDVYNLITTSNDPCNAVQRLLTEASSPYLSLPYLTLPFPSLHQGGDEDSQKEMRPHKPPSPPPEPVSLMAEDSDAYRLAALMRDTLKANLPTFREPDLQKWAQAFATAINNDERMGNYDFVAQIISWACSHQFWRGNIQHPNKLHEKFDQLAAKMELELSRSNKTSAPQEWKSPAERRVEANKAAAEEAKRILFGDCDSEKDVAHES